jgi:hypothetical protein
MDLAEFISKMNIAGYLEEGLDELVHKFKSQEASDINNSGRSSQLQYLYGAGFRPGGNQRRTGEKA